MDVEGGYKDMLNKEILNIDNQETKIINYHNYKLLQNKYVERDCQRTPPQGGGKFRY